MTTGDGKGAAVARESPANTLLRQETLTVNKLNTAQRKALKKLFWVDELYHTGGVLVLVITVFVLARWPQHFWLLHLALTAVLLPYRYYRFKKTGAELYMTDFCYFGNYATFICCLAAFLRTTVGVETFLHSYNAALIRSGFAFATGPLAWSVWIFRNSFVFHQIDHTTSVFIHLYPAILFWCIRWGGGLGLTAVEEAWPDMFHVCPMLGVKEADACMSQIWCSACPTGIRDMMLHPILVYLIWVIPHYLYLFVYWGEASLKAARKDILYFYLRSFPAVNKALSKVPPGAGPPLYLFAHFLSVLVFGALGLVLWHSFLLHSLFLLWVFVVSVRNGSAYIFQVFGMRYAHEQLETHTATLAMLRSQSSSSSAAASPKKQS